MTGYPLIGIAEGLTWAMLIYGGFAALVTVREVWQQRRKK